MKPIDELKERARQHHISESLFAEAYIGLGEKDEAMAWLERAYEEHDQWMVYINSYPGWDDLRSEPRFQALVQPHELPAVGSALTMVRPFQSASGPKTLRGRARGW